MVKFPDWPLRYGASILFVFGVLLPARSIPTRMVTPGLGAIVCLLAVIPAAAYGGFGPGIAATLVIAAGAYPRPMTPANATRHVMFVAGGVGISLVGGRARASRLRSTASDSQLAALLRGLGDPVIATDLSGRITFMNTQAQELTGWTEAEARGVSLPNVFRVDTDTDLADRAVRGRATVSVPEGTRLTPRNASPRPIEGAAAPVLDARGRASGVVLVFRDATERLRAEESLQVQAQLNRAITESAGEAVFLTDERGRVTSLNPEARRLFGFSTEEIAGRVLHDVVHHHDADGRPVPESECPLCGPSPGGEVVRGHEDQFFRSDGSAVEVICSRSPVALPGHRTGAVLIAQDIGGLKKTERELRESSRFNQFVIQNSQDGLFLLDRQLRYRVWNPAMERFTGLRADEVLGRAATDVFPEIQEFGIARVFERVLAGESGLVAELHLKTPIEPGKRWFSATHSPVRSAEGDVDGVIVLIRDIDDQRRVEQANATYARRLEHLREIDVAILEARSAREVSSSAMERLTRIVPSWMSCVLIYDFPRNEFEVLASAGRLGKLLPAGTRAGHLLENNPCVETLKQGRNWVSADVPNADHRSPVVAALAAEGLRSCVFAPLTVGGELIGSLDLGSDRVDDYTQADVDAIRGVADRLAVAIRQALLLKELQDSKENLELLSRRLINAEEGERRRISRELHDEIGQSLTALKIHMHVACKGLPADSPARARLDDGATLIDHTIKQVRGISLDLRPSLLDDLGLVAAVRALVHRQAKIAGFAARFTPDADDLAFRLDTETETACYRVAQEALTNVARYAQAAVVEVALRLGPRDLRLTVRDDGSGFDAGAAQARADSGVSTGMIGMRERVVLLGGRFQIRSAPGEGVEVCAEFPVHADGPDLRLDPDRRRRNGQPWPADEHDVA